MIKITTGNTETDKVLQSADVQTAIQTALDSQTDGLKTKRDELFTEMGKQKSTLSELTALGGLDKFKELQSQLSEADKQAQEDKLKQAQASGDVEKINEAHSTQITELTKTIDGLKSSMVQKELNTIISAEILSQNGIPELLTPLIGGRVRGMYSESGAINYEVKNVDGSPMLTAEGRDATIEHLVNSLRTTDHFSSAFRGTGSSGMNSTQSDDVGNASENPFSAYGKETFDLTKAMVFMKTNPEKGRKLAKEAGFPVMT
jgi:hypothetical protein